MNGMKSVADNKKHDTDFYLSNVAPLKHQRETPCKLMDMILLTVLFVEIGGLIRLLLAK